jgi:hypothetical protein
LEDGTDTAKLCVAIGWHETKSGKHAIGKWNFWNIMHWPNGKRKPKDYGSYEEGLADCVRIWSTYYKRFPDYNLAYRYVCGAAKDCDEVVWGWLATVKQKFNE